MNFIEMQRILSAKLHQKIKKLTTPLIDHFGLNEFYHYRLSNTGHYVNVGLNCEWEEFYFSNPSHLIMTPYFRHPKFFKSGVSFMKETPDLEFEKLVTFGREQFQINLSSHITKKTKDGLSAYGFGLNTQDLQQHFNLANSLPLLHLFIEKFDEEMKPFESLLEDTQVDMASLMGSKFYEPPTSILKESSFLDPFLQQLGLKHSSPLTAREIDVIQHLLNGNSASLIADHLCLSSRTVEHHIERIKDKFDCFTKADLIKILRRLESIDYFS